LFQGKNYIPHIPGNYITNFRNKNTLIQSFITQPISKIAFQPAWTKILKTGRDASHNIHLVKLSIMDYHEKHVLKSCYHIPCQSSTIYIIIHDTYQTKTYILHLYSTWHVSMGNFYACKVQLEFSFKIHVLAFLIYFFNKKQISEHLMLTIVSYLMWYCCA